MALQRLPMLRTTFSANFDSGENVTIGSMKYDPSASDRLVPTTFDGDSSLVSPVPIVISSYHFELVTDTMGQMWQSYHDDDDFVVAQSWNPGSSEFLQHLKQDKLVPGAVRQADIGQHSAWGVRTIRFRAGNYSKRLSKKYGKKIHVGGPAPIVLSANKKNMMSWCISNVGNNDDRSYYCNLKIDKWHQVK